MKKINNSKVPVYRDAGFSFDSLEQIEAVFTAEKNNPWQPEYFIYSRYRNPTVRASEQQLADIEKSEWALLSASGMASIDTALSILHQNKTKKILFFSEIYGGTISYTNFILSEKRGLKFDIFYTQNGIYNLSKLEEKLKSGDYELLYFEAVSNPFLIVSDGKEIITLAKKYEVKVIVDNTFATSYLWKPLTDRADLVVHSATKYLAGHGSLTAGVLCGNDTDLLALAIEYRKWTGAITSPDDASRLSEQLATFELRMQKHNLNAMQLAQYLQLHPKIAKIIYPGLKKDRSFPIAQKLFKNKGFGAMLTFELAAENNAQKQEKLIKYLNKSKEFIPIIPSLGETQTIQLPIYAVWKDRCPSPSYIRLSVGIENIDYLIDIFDKCL